MRKIIFFLIILLLVGSVTAREITVSNGISLSDTSENATVIEKEIIFDMSTSPDKIGTISDKGEGIEDDKRIYSITPISDALRITSSKPAYKAEYIAKYSDLLGKNIVYLNNDTVEITIESVKYDANRELVQFNLTGSVNGVEKLIHNPYKIYNPPVLVQITPGKPFNTSLRSKEKYIPGNYVENIDNTILISIAENIKKFEDGKATFDGVDPTAIIYAHDMGIVGTDMGCENTTYNKTFLNLIKSNGTVVDTEYGYSTPGFGFDNENNISMLIRSGMNFNTSIIGINRTIYNASIGLYIAWFRNDFPEVSNLSLTQFSPASNTSYVMSDYQTNKTGSTRYTDDILYANISVDNWSYANFTPTGISQIDKTKYTNIMGRLSMDTDSVNYTHPTGYPIYNDTWIMYASPNTSGTSYDPYLNIIYGDTPSPISSFTTNVTSGYNPLAVQFNDTSTNVSTNWNWSFNNVTGNATTVYFSTVQNISYTFNVGNFSIKLNASNYGGYNLSSQTTFINVSAPATTKNPIVNFTYNSSGGIQNVPVLFTSDSVTTITAYNWSLGGGNYSTTGPTLTYTYSVPGTYSVSLNVTNASGFNSSTKTNIITITQRVLPITNFTYNNSGGIQDVPVQFTSDSVTTITAYNWSFGDGNYSTTQSPIKTYSVPGTYSVSLNTTNVSGYNSTTKTNIITITARKLPIVNFTYNNTGGVQNVPVQFTSNSITSISAYNWSFGDGNYSTTQNPLKEYSVPGTFSVGLNVTNASGFNSTTKTNIIIILGRVLPIVNFTANKTSGMGTLPVQFTSDSVTTITAYNWSFGDGNYSTTQNPIKTYSPGIFTVSLNVTNASGYNLTTKTNYISVSAIVLPVPIFSANITSGFTPLPVLFTDGSITSISAWNWSFGDGDYSSASNPVHTYSSLGSYDVVLTVQNASGVNATTKTSYINTYTPIVANFYSPVTHSSSIPATIAFYDTSSGIPDTWSWIFGDGGSSASQNPNHVYTSAGLYSITLLSSNSSTGSSDGEAKTFYISITNATGGMIIPVNATGIDLPNYSKSYSWLYYLSVTNRTGPWDFPVLAFAYGIMSPFTDAFEQVGGPGWGSAVYLILWGIFLLMVWRNSGKVSIVAIACVITSGAFALLIPKWSQPTILILMGAAIASTLLTFFARED